MKPNADEAAHAFSLANRASLSKGGPAGCFYCRATFPGDRVREWVDDPGGQTALCPHCGIDSVLALQDLGGLGVDRDNFRSLLRAMQRRWF